MICASNRSSWN